MLCYVTVSVLGQGSCAYALVGSVSLHYLRGARSRIKGTCEFYLVVAWVVPGGFNVASRWGCVQGVWEQCRCWSLGMGSRVSDGITEVAAQRLCKQLKTVLITLSGETESKKCVCVCARVCGTVWRVVSGLRGVLIGPLIVWNRTNKCVRFFSWRGCRGAGAWLFSRFSSSQKMHLIWGSRCHLSVFHWGR